jgi:hypothetical protein
MELTNDQKHSSSPAEGKPSTENSTPLNNAPTKPVIVDDIELNEEQLDIISGGGDPFSNSPKG